MFIYMAFNTSKNGIIGASGNLFTFFVYSSDSCIWTSDSDSLWSHKSIPQFFNKEAACTFCHE